MEIEFNAGFDYIHEAYAATAETGDEGDQWIYEYMDAVADDGFVGTLEDFKAYEIARMEAFIPSMLADDGPF